MQNKESEEKPLITVVTATYKKFERVFDTIKSVLNQDYSNIEYIICDDGSDNFPKSEIISCIQENKKDNIAGVKIFDSDKNRGTVRNLNYGYKNSNGKYFVNLSCGDVFYSDDVISRIVDRFIKTDSDVVVASRISYNGDYNPVCFLPHYEDRSLIEKFDTALKQYTSFITSRYYAMASGSAMYFSRRIMEKLNYFDETYILWEDGPFLSRYLWENKLEFAYDIVSIWYETSGVSSVNVSEMSPLLRKDIYQFYDNEKDRHFDKLKKCEIRTYRFNRERVRAKKTNEKIKISLRYFPEAVAYILYSEHRKKMQKKDKDYIAELIKSDKPISFKKND